jgi:MFS family permease
VSRTGTLLTNPIGRRLAAVSLVDSAGSGAYVTAGVVLFHEVLGLSSAQIGKGFAAASIVGMVISIWWGGLADRVGVRTVWVTLQLWRAAGCVALIFVRDYPHYVAALIFLGIAERASQPIMLLFLTRAVGEQERVRMAGAVRAVRNAGYAAGAALSALALIAPSHRSLAVVVLCNAVSFVFAAFMLWSVPLREPAVRLRGGGRTDGESVRHHPAFLAATVLSGVLSIHRQILAVGLPLWLVTRKIAPSSTVSILAVVNTVMVVLLQVRFVRNTETAQGAALVLRRAGWALAALSALVAASVVSLPGRPYSMIVLLLTAVMALTVAEMWQAAGAWGLSFALSPPKARGRFLSVFNLGPSAQDVVGALLLTSLVLPHGAVGWLLLGVLLLICGLAAPRVARWGATERSRETAAADA